MRECGYYLAKVNATKNGTVLTAIYWSEIHKSHGINFALIVGNIWEVKNQMTPQEKYDRAHTKGLYLKLNKETDRDILEHLQKQDNKQGYIKKLIREDMGA